MGTDTTAGTTADEPTKDEVDRLAKEMAQRVMSKPHRPQAWPKKPAEPKAPRRKPVVTENKKPGR